MPRKVPVSVLGERGVLGREYTRLLNDHPWFHLTPPDEAELIFSALPNPAAQELEPTYTAQGKALVSHASFQRLHPEIPLIIPEVNPEHLALFPKRRIVCKPNCTLQAFVIPLAPLRPFGIEKIAVTTLQAVSGAGKKGVELEDNILPYIDGEEEKTEREPLKIFGNPHIRISSQCTRVPVSHGHMVCVSVKFSRPPTREEILELWRQPSPLDLPTAPKYPVHYLEEKTRPQPLLDRDCENGMGVTVGRLRPCSLFDWRFVALSHNVVRGGSGGGLLTAELLLSEGYLGQTESQLCSSGRGVPLS